MRTYDIELNGTSEARRTVRGKYLRVLSASGEIETTLGTGPKFTLEQGIGIERSQGFDELTFSGSAQTIRIAVSDERIDDSRLSLSAAVDLTKSTVLDDAADVSMVALATTLIAAADSARREIIITNLDGNAAILRIGSSAAAAARGTPLAVGAAIALTTGAAVYAYNPGVVAQSVAVSLIKD